LVYKTNIFLKLLELFDVDTSLFFLHFFCGIWVFCSSRKHLLITFLRLEFLVLALFIIIYFYLCLFNYELYFVMFFLVLSVCEGSFHRNRMNGIGAHTGQTNIQTFIFIYR
jgi:NADH-ubiquinone oxidoreductase chain 4L